MNSKLKPCPFCGGEDIEILSCGFSTIPSHQGRCCNCGSLGAYQATYKKVVEKWNTREQPEQQEKLKEL